MRFFSVTLGVLLLACTTASAADTANAAGVWHWSVIRADGHDVKVTLTLTQSGEKISGTFHGEGDDSQIYDGSVQGDQITFATHRNISSRKVTLTFTGKISGNTITGKMDAQVGLGERKSDWTATREAAK